MVLRELKNLDLSRGSEKIAICRGEWKKCGTQNTCTLYCVVSVFTEPNVISELYSLNSELLIYIIISFVNFSGSYLMSS